MLPNTVKATAITIVRKIRASMPLSVEGALLPGLLSVSFIDKG
jgi:hypothetical protein